MNPMKQILLVFLFSVLLVSLAFATASDDVHSSPKEGTPHKPSPFQPTSVEDGIFRWQLYWSGRPSDCMRSQFLFTGDGVIETSNNTIRNVGPIYRYCEALWQKAFQEIEIFITSPHYYLSEHTVAFERTILYLTHENCRVSSQGITILEFNDAFLIKKWRDIYNKEELNQRLDKCDLYKLFKDLEEESSSEKSDGKSEKQEL
jgi:hypothetical protein